MRKLIVSILLIQCSIGYAKGMNVDDFNRLHNICVSKNINTKFENAKYQICASELVNEADSKMEKSFKEMINNSEEYSKLRNIRTKYPINTRDMINSFINSQILWQKFRDSECQAYAKFYIGNDRRSVIQFGCRFVLAQQRMNQLNDRIIELRKNFGYLKILVQ